MAANRRSNRQFSLAEESLSSQFAATTGVATARFRLWRPQFFAIPRTGRPQIAERTYNRVIQR